MVVGGFRFMDLIKSLKNLGLNEKEARVYVALLQLGKASAKLSSGLAQIFDRGVDGADLDVAVRFQLVLGDPIRDDFQLHAVLGKRLQRIGGVREVGHTFGPVQIQPGRPAGGPAGEPGR